jgi:hypothetical protein
MPQTVIDQVAEVSKAASTPPAPESPPSS